MRKSLIVSAITLLAATGAWAGDLGKPFHGHGKPLFSQNTAADLVGRNVEQARRIEDGLRGGQLHTREAGQLQATQANILRQQAAAMADGFVDLHEKHRITEALNDLNRQIASARHDADRGFRQSSSVQRMLADVRRGLDQQQRIERGLRSGQLNLREASRLQHAQAAIVAREAQAARDGYVTALEQASVQRARNVQGQRIQTERNDRR